MDWYELADRAVERGALQKAGELAALLALASERGVRSVLEIGAKHGGASWAFAQIAEHVTAIDLVPATWATPGVHEIRGDSHSRSTSVAAHRGHGSPFDLILIDGDHTYEGVRQDFETYSSLLASDGIVAIHDILTPNLPRFDNCEVRRFWQEVKQRHSHTEIIDPVEQQWHGGSLPADAGGIGILYGVAA